MFSLTRYSDDELATLAEEVRRERLRRDGKTISCEECGTEFQGRKGARFCSSSCRVASHRRREQIPQRLRQLDRWVRHDRKRPITVVGAPASSTDPSTWSTFAAARSSAIGTGLGFVLNGDGIGCFDLDHCLIDGRPTPAAAVFLNALQDAFYVEVSPSGDGLHVWCELEDGPGRKYVEDGLSIERYSTGRYITITGKEYRR